MSIKKYDYLIVGAGLFGATFAEHATRDKKNCLIIDKRSHTAGNCYTEKTEEGIDIHKYGPHIFHTNNKKIWDYINQFSTFNNYINRPKVNFNKKIFSFPINLFTLYQLWGTTNPSEAIQKLRDVRIKNSNPQNLEEWILDQVGQEIYNTFIYGYTKKQWGREPKDLPSFIIKRLPIRLTYDDNYFMDKYQGIPENGYTSIVENMVEGCEISLETNYFRNRDYYDGLADTIVYTGPIDEFFDYQYGKLDYRSLKFETTKLNIEDFQGNAIINYTDIDTKFTRIVEHKHFNLKTHINTTYITKEFPVENTNESEPFYPINDEKNSGLINKYKTLSEKIIKNKIIFGGRLAEYKYYDMHQIIGSAINSYNKHNNKNK